LHDRVRHVRAVSGLANAAWSACSTLCSTSSVVDWPYRLTSERAVDCRFANTVAAVIYGTGLEVETIVGAFFVEYLLIYRTDFRNLFTV